MSLDVYLTMPGEKRLKPAGRIFVRENGGTKELSREEWDQRYPGREPVTVGEMETDKVHHGNITHNLGAMAEEAGIYRCLWRPDEIAVTKANQLIEPLRVGLALLKSDPARFEKLNSANGWGAYEQFVPFVENYLRACEEYPEADVSVWR